MRFYKVDIELNRVCDERDLDYLSINDEYELGTSDTLSIFSSANPSSIWVDQRLMSDNKPLLRILVKNSSEGTEYCIRPLVPTLIGSIILSSIAGNYKYNLIFET